MRSTKVEYSTAAGVYCMMYDVKVTFCIHKFYIRRIINHLFHVDNYKGKLGIRYKMIIERDLMVQLDLTAYFKRQFLQWDGATIHIK